MMLGIVAGVGVVAGGFMVRRPRTPQGRDAAEANTPLLGADSFGEL
jgi:hypothetical protein